MSSEHSEATDVMGKHTEGRSSSWYKGLITLTRYDQWIILDSAAANLDYIKAQRVICLYLMFFMKGKHKLIFLNNSNKKIN